MYHAARALLALKNLYPKTHRGVLRAFGLKVVKENEVEEYYGQALRFVKEKREKSDYDYFAIFSKEEAEVAIEDAENSWRESKRR